MMPRERLTPKEIQVATLVWEGLTNCRQPIFLVSRVQVVSAV